MKSSHIYVDYENVQVKSISLLESTEFNITIFLGPTNKNLPVDLVLAMRHLGNRADYVAIDKSAANALDFCIAYYVGQQVSKKPNDSYYIISKDTGFDPLIKHLKSKSVDISRATSIAEMSCFSIPSDSNESTILEEPKEIINNPDEDLSKDKSSHFYTITPIEKVNLQQTAPIPPQQKPKSIIPDLVEIAINDLIKRKASKPRTEKTLISTIHAKCGKEISVKDIRSVYETLVRRGFVIQNGERVSYDLPS